MSTPVLPPAPRPADWKAAAPAPPPGTTTFAAQASLPRLPVLPLAPTLARLKRSLAPLAHTPDELAAAEARIDAFAEGPGPELQGRLEVHAQGREHWLEEWWDDAAYLTYRDPVMINVSYYYGFADPPAETVPAGELAGPAAARYRAASLTRAAMLYRAALKRGEVPAEGTKDAPFCMDTYRWMFDCTRVPGAQGADWSVSYAQEGDTSGDGHVVVLRNGHFWRLEAARGGRVLSTPELEAQLDHIIAHSAEPRVSPGALTHANRDTWAAAYPRLRAQPENAAALDALASCAFVLCLDAAAPADFTTTSHALWHGAPGGLRTRWADKPVQLIVFDNARAGLAGEHSVMDGTPTLAFMDSICAAVSAPSFDHGLPGPLEEALGAPRELPWALDADMQRDISDAERGAQELIDAQALTAVRTPYGKRAIKAARVSPDAWAQLALQLAYARVLPRAGGTYESATTRRFVKGRTEVIRVVTAESDAFVRAMLDPASGADARKAAFEAAAKVHVANAQAAGRGEGVDRHLLGLRKVLKPDEPVPALYADPLVQRASHWALSTSALASRYLREYGWGAVVPDGFGVAYITSFDEYMQFTVTSRKEMPNAAFADAILRAADDLYALYFPEGEARKSRL
ncbi:acyltransferase ChoActase/COT/CPT [Gloeopeniophorella convolvens]|nr:acyltransferase ChoActase/COT/CPT [Gloeopeniophorella convolvens]